jgi:predicted AlkP superfamily pyrophosphatase or phosphodiesterase
MKSKAIHLILFLFLLISCLAQNNPPNPQAKHEKKEKPFPLTSRVILISIDGLRNEDFNNQKLNLPTLKALRERGAFALNVESIFPSQSIPAHATIVTGMYPSDHGIYSDLHFDEKNGLTSAEKYQTAHEIKTETIWQAAKQIGLKTAAVNFPLTEKADLDFNAPEINASVFDWIEKNNPQLVLIRFDELSKALQQFGIGSPEAKSALEQIDDSLMTITRSLEQSGLTNETTFLVVSSHGYTKVEQEFRPNVILAKKGFLTLDAKGNITDWIASTRSSGGAAAIYLQDSKNEETAKVIEAIFEEIHKQESSPIWRIISRKDAMRLGADARAAFFLEAAPGFVISEQTTGKKTVEKLKVSAGRAASGYLPSRSEMRGTLIATGKGIKSKTQIEYARLVDIAPTIARLLGLELKTSRGHAISEIIIQPRQK